MGSEHLVYIPRKAKIFITLAAFLVFASSVVVVFLFLRHHVDQGILSLSLTLAQSSAAGLSVIAIIFYTRFSVNVSDLKEKNADFLISEVPDALRIVEYCEAPFVEITKGYASERAFPKSKVLISHNKGNHYCQYIVKAYGRSQRIYVQANVKRMVVSYFLPVESVDDEQIRERLDYVVTAAETAGYTYEYKKVYDEAEQTEGVQLRLFRKLSDEFLIDPSERLYVANDFASMTRALIRALPK